jgi:predicted negative regulator of RcsB-dependent stress response
MRNVKIYVILLVLAAMIGYFGYNYFYQGHRDINTEAAAVETLALQLSEEFKKDTTQLLLNKTVIVTGTITEIDGNTITLDNAVHGAFDTMSEALSVNTQIKLKGRCIGYDDLFELVKLDQCSILK